MTFVFVKCISEAFFKLETSTSEKKHSNKIITQVKHEVLIKSVKTATIY